MALVLVSTDIQVKLLIDFESQDDILYHFSAFALASAGNIFTLHTTPKTLSIVPFTVCNALSLSALFDGTGQCFSIEIKTSFIYIC
jgi:hypothetical protein